MYLIGIGIVLIVSILLINTQVRIVSSLFPNDTSWKKILRYNVCMGAVVASLLFLFTSYIQPQLQGWYDDIRYACFVLITGGAVTLLFAKQKQRRGVFFISTATVLSLITGLSQWMLAGSGMVLLKAAGEEILKSTGWQALASHTKKCKSDIIIMSILTGLGFALCENVIYFIAWWSRWEFIVRSLVTSLLHGVFTGVIGYIVRRQQRASFLWYIYAYIAGILLHGTYNITIATYPITWSIVFLLGGYMLFSYLLYKTDRLYLKNK